MPCKDLGEMLLVVERQWGCFTGLLGALKVAMVAKVMSGHARVVSSCFVGSWECCCLLLSKCSSKLAFLQNPGCMSLQSEPDSKCLEDTERRFCHSGKMLSSSRRQQAWRRLGGVEGFDPFLARHPRQGGSAAPGARPVSIRYSGARRACW